MRHFLQYWRTYNPALQYGKPISYAASEQFSRVSPGDVLWIVALKEQRLTLLGRLAVGEIVGKEQFLRSVEKPLYDAHLYAVAQPGTTEVATEIDIQALAPLLRFASDIDRLTFASPGHTDGKQMQAIRELTPDSAELLGTILQSDSTGALEPEESSAPSGKRNPKWSRDELILALDLYFKHPPTTIGKNHPAVIGLSEILNKLGVRLGYIQNEKFRNANGVYMKLCNFLRLDPSYNGEGLKAGGKLEEVVWKQFSDNRDELRRTAQAIIETIENESESLEAMRGDDDELEFEEGAVLYRTHRARERSRELVQKAKEKARAQRGRLDCEICGFDFHAMYGDVGNGYIECHHTVPVSELKLGTKTRLEDVVLLCANCHRMIHRRRPWLRMEDVRRLIDAQMGSYEKRQ